jgi:amino acid efflux transporter
VDDTPIPALSSDGPAPRPVALRKAIRRRNAVALYVSSVLGSGILVLPGLTAHLAGPGSLLAWVLLAFASIPFALTFASLSASRPESGGVYGFAKEAFGPRVAIITGWLFALWVVTGAPAIALIAASYLGYAFPLTHLETFVIGFVVVLAAFLVNYRGITLSNKVQLSLIVSVVVLLILAVALSLFRVRPENFQPFLPYGLVPVGTASALIFWSFLGYENVSNVAEEFEDPKRDFRRAVYLSVVIVGVLYFAVAFVTVGTRAYVAGGGVAPFAAIFGNVFGGYGAAATAVLAVIIVFGVANAYTTGMSRVAYATARDGGFPQAMAHLDPRTQVPDLALLGLLGAAAVVFACYYVLGIGLTSALLVASGAAITVYIIGSAAAVRIHHRAGRAGRTLMVLGAVSLGISVVVLPFIGWPIVIAGGVLLGGFVYTSLAWRRPGSVPPTRAGG